MAFEYTVGEIGLKIKATPSMAKCISVIRRYNPISMGEIKKAIETNQYVFSVSAISHSGIKKVRKCFDELTKLGAEVDIYDEDQLSSRELISNLIVSHQNTVLEVKRQVDEETAEEE